MNQETKIAVIGTGRMGSVHVANLMTRVPGADLAAICDIRLDVAGPVARQWGIERVVEDYHDLLKDENIEAVLIATSTNTHAKIIKHAAQAGKHIFCEKPLALDIQEIDDALQAVERAGVMLQVGFNRRFDRSFQKVREIVASGELGRPCILRITNRDPELPALEFLKVSGGLFLDMTIHDFDMARFQIGEVDEVYAVGNALINSELNAFGDLDTAVVTLTFKNGTIGVIDNSRQATYGYDQQLEVLCLEGAARAENEIEHTAVKANHEGFHSARVPHFFMQRYASCYVDEVSQFIHCVQENKPTPTIGYDGLMAVVIGHAAWRSYHEHRPVKISEIFDRAI